MKARQMTIEITVTVPVVIGENEVANAINAALDEPPCEWGDWMVGAAIIKKVKRVEVDEVLEVHP